jgi:hypothetical protein
MMSAQTAMLAVICRLLVKRQALDHDELVRELHELLSMGLNSQPAATGPIKHLLSILEE